jgi:hypothetical protein
LREVDQAVESVRRAKVILMLAGGSSYSGKGPKSAHFFVMSQQSPYSPIAFRRGGSCSPSKRIWTAFGQWRSVPMAATLASGSSDKSIKLWNVPESAVPQYATIREFFRLMAKLTDRTDIEFLQVTENFRVMVKVAEAVQGVPLEVLSQGLTSLLGWVGVLCQRLKETTQNAVDTSLATDAYALVLVDEIDAHMHPGWQQVLVKRLGQLFPRVQFIATLHSPLVVGGLEPTEVYRFDRMADGLVEVIQPEVALKGMSAAGLLTSPLFGLRSQLILRRPKPYERSGI